MKSGLEKTNTHATLDVPGDDHLGGGDTKVRCDVFDLEIFSVNVKYTHECDLEKYVLREPTAMRRPAWNFPEESMLRGEYCCPWPTKMNLN